jgi:capsular polysaccharide transport system permease protein
MQARGLNNFTSRLWVFLDKEKSVLSALILREMGNRFGRFKLGYAWALLEPLGYIGVFSLIRSVFGTSDLAGLSFPLFFATGIIPFILFSSSLTQSMLALRSNQSLFNYRQVRPYHCILSRQILEFITYLTSGVVVLALFFLLGFATPINNLGGCVWILFLFSLFCLGLGLIMAVVGPFFQEAEKIVPVLMRPMFLISGIFLPTLYVPDEYLGFFLWNPVLHAVELLRYHLFLNYQPPFTDSGYLALVSFSVLLVGIAMYRVSERRLLTSGKVRVR